MSDSGDAACLMDMPPFERTPTGDTGREAPPAALTSRDDWQELIDYKLIEWGRDPDQLAEHELIPPTTRAVQRAIQIAKELQARKALPPMRVVPDGDGGIVMERWCGPWSVSIEIDHHGVTELVVVRDCHVVDRRPYDVGR
jgi:hypothetical protein